MHQFFTGFYSTIRPTGREKLELGEVRIKVVLEADGTQVEDPEYFCTLPENTVFLLLRQGEHWYPAGVEVLRQGSHPGLSLFWFGFMLRIRE